MKKALVLLGIFWAMTGVCLAQATISIDTSSIDFATAAGRPTVGPIAFTLYVPVVNPGASKAAFRVYTKNNELGYGNLNRSGLIGATNHGYTAPFKVWCSNFGPTAAMPNPNNATNWANYWGWVLDYDDPSVPSDFLVYAGFTIGILPQFRSALIARFILLPI